MRNPVLLYLEGCVSNCCIRLESGQEQGRFGQQERECRSTLNLLFRGRPSLSDVRDGTTLRQCLAGRSMASCWMSSGICTRVCYRRNLGCPTLAAVTQPLPIPGCCHIAVRRRCTRFETKASRKEKPEDEVVEDVSATKPLLHACNTEEV